MIASAWKKILDRHLHFRRRAACSEIRPILTREADFFCDLRAFSSNQSLWSSTGFVRSVQYESAERQISRFSMYDGTKVYCQQAKNLQMVLEGLYKSKLQFRFRLYWPCMTKRLPETMGNHVIKGWRHLWGYTLIRRWELVASEPEMKQWKEEQLPRAEKERKPTLRGKVGECSQSKTNGQRSKGDPCSSSHESVSGNRYEAERGKG